LHADSQRYPESHEADANPAIMQPIKDRGVAMSRFLLLTGVVLLIPAFAFLLIPAFAFAESSPDPAQCEQLRQAVAQYGYAAARRHALEIWGPEAVKFGDKCFTKKPRQRN